MITCYDTIKVLIRTEKSEALLAQGKYVFRVAKSATKIDIKNAIEEIYNVKVESVNVINVSGKKKRVRREIGYTAGWKKAIVTLQEGQSIEVS